MSQQAEALDTLELKLQMVVLFGLGAGNQTQITMKVQQVLLTSELSFEHKDFCFQVQGNVAINTAFFLTVLLVKSLAFFKSRIRGYCRISHIAVVFFK